MVWFSRGKISKRYNTITQRTANVWLLPPMGRWPVITGLNSTSPCTYSCVWHLLINAILFTASASIWQLSPILRSGLVYQTYKIKRSQMLISNQALFCHSIFTPGLSAAAANILCQARPEGWEECSLSRRLVLSLSFCIPPPVDCVRY